MHCSFASAVLGLFAAVFGVLMMTAGCATGSISLQQLSSPPCVAAGRVLDWVGPSANDRTAVARAWCESVGPPVLRRPGSDAADRPPADSGNGLVIVSWNVHEGAGDIVRVVNLLRPADVVIVVQEALRTGDVPLAYPADVRPPRREAAKRPAGDIVDIADALGLWLVYVPSMRNGTGREDRGCAILSTLPLSDPVAIQLPWVTQRRVAVAATISRRPPQQPLRVVSAHLDNRPGRRRQSAALAQWLSTSSRADVPLVVGADLNSWFGEGEDTVQQIARVVPLVPGCDDRPTFRYGRRLDYIFTSATTVDECQVGASTYGSDHHPLILTVAGAGDRR